MSGAVEYPGWRDGVMRRIAGATFRAAGAKGAIILAFHQISPEKFERWIVLLRESFLLVPLDEIVERRKSGQSLAGLLAVTFDDGWADTCEPIAAMCEQNGWPVMMYIISRSCCEGTTLWFAELPKLLDAARGRRIERDGWVLDLTSPRSERVSTERLMSRLKLLPGREALQVIDRLSTAAGLTPPERRKPFVDGGFVRKYRYSEWVKFGSHTADHRALAPQNDAQLDAQWIESQCVLEDVIGQRVRHFAYPYGAPDNIGERAPQIIGRHYDSAVTMSRGVVAGSSELSRMPRVPLYDEDTEARMITKIALAPWI